MHTNHLWWEMGSGNDQMAAPWQSVPRRGDGRWKAPLSPVSSCHEYMCVYMDHLSHTFGKISELLFTNNLKGFYWTHYWGRYSTIHNKSPGEIRCWIKVISWAATSRLLPTKPQLLNLLKTAPKTHNIQDLLWAHRKEEHAVLCYFPFHLPLAPQRTNQRKARCVSEELFKWAVTMNLLPPPLAGISKLPSPWTPVTEDSLLQKKCCQWKISSIN